MWGISTIMGAKTKNDDVETPNIRLVGKWLGKYGFEVDSWVSVHYKKDEITIKLEGKGQETYDCIAKDTLNSNTKLLQVKRGYGKNKNALRIELKDYWIQDMGFNIGDFCVKVVEYGLITFNTI